MVRHQRADRLWVWAKVIITYTLHHLINLGDSNIEAIVFGLSGQPIMHNEFGPLEENTLWIPVLNRHLSPQKGQPLLSHKSLFLMFIHEGLFHNTSKWWLTVWYVVLSTGEQRKRANLGRRVPTAPTIQYYPTELGWTSDPGYSFNNFIHFIRSHLAAWQDGRWKYQLSCGFRAVERKTCSMWTQQGHWCTKTTGQILLPFANCN